MFEELMRKCSPFLLTVNGMLTQPDSSSLPLPMFFEPEVEISLCTRGKVDLLTKIIEMKVWQSMSPKTIYDLIIQSSSYLHPYIWIYNNTRS